jgi:RimJ/RimL family protein N-acetyltransferase
MSEHPDLATNRLLLRLPNHGDVDAIVGIVGEWDVARRLARVPHPYSPADARAFLDHVVPAEWVWAVTLKGSSALVGVVGLTPAADANTAELGYWLSSNHWGQGIATEAARAVVAFGFEVLGFPSLTSGYFEENPASGRVLKKLGFIETGRMMWPSLAAGVEVPTVRMQMSRETESNGYKDA